MSGDDPLTIQQQIDALVARVYHLENFVRDNLSGNWEMPPVEILRQRDPRWAQVHYGNSLAPYTSTIGAYGCLLTSLCYVSNILHKANTWKPDAANVALVNANGYVNGNRVVFVNACAALGLKFENLITTSAPLTAAHMAQIDHWLGVEAVIVKVDNSPASGIQEHWIALTERQGNNFQIADPWYNDDGFVQLCPRYPQNAGVPKDPAHAIEAMLFVSKGMSG